MEDHGVGSGRWMKKESGGGGGVKKGVDLGELGDFSDAGKYGDEGVCPSMWSWHITYQQDTIFQTSTL